MPAKIALFVFVAIFIMLLLPVPVHQIFPLPIPVNDYYYDVVTCCALFFWAHQRLIVRQSGSALLSAVEKTCIFFLVLGLVPVMVGLWNGNEHLFYSYRFFLYSVWVPFIMVFFKNEGSACRGFRWVLIANFIFALGSVGMRLWGDGLSIAYLPISYEINTLCVIILLYLILFRIKLFRSGGMLYFMAATSILAIILDPTRRVYIFCGVSGILMIGHLRMRRHLGIRGIFAMAIAAILGLTALRSIGLAGSIAERLGSLVEYAARASGAASIDVEPGVFDQSIGFRAAAFSIGLDAIKEHPFFGIGTGYDAEYTEKLIDIGTADFQYPGGGSHSFFISALRHFGFLIMIPTIFLWGRLLWRGWRTGTSSMADDSQVCRACGQAALFGFAGFAVVLVVTAYTAEIFLDIWLFCGLALGMANQVIDRAAPPRLI